MYKPCGNVFSKIAANFLPCGHETSITIMIYKQKYDC